MSEDKSENATTPTPQAQPTIPSWANPGMPSMNWPEGTRTSEQDCAEQTAKFEQGKKQ